jgi:hypothetical protein
VADEPREVFFNVYLDPRTGEHVERFPRSREGAAWERLEHSVAERLEADLYLETGEQSTSHAHDFRPTLIRPRWQP